MSDWHPEQYLKFERERTQPSIDLINRVHLLEPRRIIDIGCGPGNSTAVLRGRWPSAEIVGLDSSQSMLEKAKAEYPDIQWLHMDAGDDLSTLGSFDLVFSNAALQWMPDHERLLANLYGLLLPGGVLALQIPYIRLLPVYREITDLAASPAWREQIGPLPEYPLHHPYEHYYAILSGLTPSIEMWQTDYIHRFGSYRGIVEWYKGSGLRPFLERLPNEQTQKAFIQEYAVRIQQAYPPQPDGQVLMPFTRIFCLAHRIEP